MNQVFDTHKSSSDPAFAPTAQQTVNRWIIGETARVRETVDAALTDYRFNDAANALYSFVWGKVCDWYVEFSKPLFGSEDAQVVAETRATMAWVLDQCLIMLHPVMPFITEELWDTLGTRDGMLVHTDWPTYSAAKVSDAKADAEMSWVISLIEGVRSARSQMHVPAGLYVPMLVKGIGAEEQAAWDRNQALILKLARIEGLTSVDDFPKGCVTVPVGQATFGLPLADIIDVGEEKARLEKSLGKLAKEIGGLKGRLSNPKFAESAPPEVVEEAQENLAARMGEEAKLKEALARLAEIG
jgi:valyl-tRNA synthetase